MIAITLPDGSVRDFDKPVSGAEIAAAIGPGLAKAALALKLNGRVVDLAAVVEQDAPVEIVTRGHPDTLELLRHDCAHVMAEAVQELYPGTQVTFGPAIENGFYYDFARSEPFTPEDLEKIEARMHEIVKRDETIAREVWDRHKAIRHFEEAGEKYKAEHVATLPGDEEISIYRQGDWLDLCIGPHLPSTGKLGHAFKLMKVSGAYWRGDARNEQLQRIYGTCWEDEKQLKAYLTMLEEAEKRDHRRLGREMDLLAPQGLDPVARRRGLHAPPPRGRRLPRGQDTPARRPQPLGGLGPLGEVPRAHVHCRVRGPDPGGQADELPLPRADLQARHHQLPRPAASDGRVRLLPPQRAFRCLARPHAGARLHPG
jgi:hypothetical protein